MDWVLDFRVKLITRSLRQNRENNAAQAVSARGGFQITKLVKSGTEHVGPGEWTYSADLKVRHRNERGVWEKAPRH